MFLTADIFFVNKIPFFLSLSRKTCFTAATHLDLDEVLGVVPIVVDGGRATVPAGAAHGRAVTLAGLLERHAAESGGSRTGKSKAGTTVTVWRLLRISGKVAEATNLTVAGAPRLTAASSGASPALSFPWCCSRGGGCGRERWVPSVGSVGAVAA